MAHFTPELLAQFTPEWVAQFGPDYSDENTASITINWQDLMTMVQSVRIKHVKSRKIVNKNLLFS
ncbi:MAG: hypothetical protein GYA71_08625 [Bacteroidales bacterium]|nr:hypothetical protein [Bacteroidales bacterium]